MPGESASFTGCVISGKPFDLISLSLSFFSLEWGCYEDLVKYRVSSIICILEFLSIITLAE